MPLIINSTDCNVVTIIFVSIYNWSFLNTRQIIIQILRRHLITMLYRNISPFCELLSFVHRSQFTIRIFCCILYELFTAYFHMNFSPLFLQQIDWYTLLILDLISIRILHCILYEFYTVFWTLSQSVFHCILYEFYTVFWTLFQSDFHCIYTTFSSLLPQIDYHIFYIALHLYTNFECCTLETMNLIVIFKILMQNPPYNVSDCPLFSWLVLSLKTVLLLPPTTVLCIFFKY